MKAEYEPSDKDYDVLVIGAGISGVNAAYRIQEQCPDMSYTILEARDGMGGTWDLFKYPGIRSDSDLYTFGFPFRPWTEERAIADGPSICKYIKETAATYGIDRHIQYHHKVTAANWSSKEQKWELCVSADGKQKQFHGRFIIFCSGYYDYEKALSARIPGIDDFQGQVIHPQFWPEDLNYQDKHVVIIGSGATAITLLPNLVDKASKVTMLQRSPSYVVNVPQTGFVSYWARRLLPAYWAHKLVRFQFLILPFLFFKFCRIFPQTAKKGLIKAAAKQLPKGYPMAPNFDPRYNPWDQRLCISPDGDFYECLRKGKAEVVTAHIKTVTEKSILLEGSERTLQPDIIVTATGLKLSMAGGAKVSVDGQAVDISQKHLWKGIMMQDVPNAGLVIGYTNASWTLGADATSQFCTRLLNHMKNKGFSSAVPRLDPKTPMGERSVINLNSTYIVEAKGDVPKAGDRAPWLPRSYYLWDLFDAKYGSITTDMQFMPRVST